MSRWKALSATAVAHVTMMKDEFVLFQLKKKQGTIIMKEPSQLHQNEKPHIGLVVEYNENIIHVNVYD